MVKFYDFARAPNPRRARMFLSEKGIEDIDIIQVDLGNKEQLGEEFRKINPLCTVPALVLDDGTLVTESVAICRYFEELQPSPSMMGRDAKEKAQVEMWQRRVELLGMLPAADAFRNTGKGWTDRAVPGPTNYAQIPELAERGRTRVEHFLGVLNQQLEVSEFVATETFTIADITAFILIEFAGWSKIEIPEEYVALRRWHQSTKARPSVKA